MTIIVHIRMAILCKLSIGCFDVILRNIIINLRQHMMMCQAFPSTFCIKAQALGMKRTLSCNLTPRIS